MDGDQLFNHFKLPSWATKLIFYIGRDLLENQWRTFALIWSQKRMLINWTC